MPELPEVETALRGVSPYLKGFIIEKILELKQKLIMEMNISLHFVLVVQSFINQFTRSLLIVFLVMC